MFSSDLSTPSLLSLVGTPSVKVSSSVRLLPRLVPLHSTYPFLFLAYDAVMFKLTLAAAIFAIPPLVMACFMPNWHLGDLQNAVEGINLAGEKVELTAEGEVVPKTEKVAA